MISLFKGRSIEFFEAGDGRLSMTRLLCFLSIFPASYVVVTTGARETLSWYLGAYVASYVGGKGADAFANARPKSIINNAEVANVAVDKPE